MQSRKIEQSEKSETNWIKEVITDKKGTLNWIHEGLSPNKESSKILITAARQRAGIQAQSSHEPADSIYDMQSISKASHAMVSQSQKKRMKSQPHFDYIRNSTNMTSEPNINSKRNKPATSHLIDKLNQVAVLNKWHENGVFKNLSLKKQRPETAATPVSQKANNKRVRPITSTEIRADGVKSMQVNTRSRDRLKPLR